MASRWNQQWKRAGRDEEAESTRPAPDPGSGTKYPQVWPSLRFSTTTFILTLSQTECIKAILFSRSIIRSSIWNSDKENTPQSNNIYFAVNVPNT